MLFFSGRCRRKHFVVRRLRRPRRLPRLRSLLRPPGADVKPYLHVRFASPVSHFDAVWTGIILRDNVQNDEIHRVA